MDPPRFMTVGVAGQDIVAVAYYTEVSDEQVHIELVAVAQQSHRQGLAADLAKEVRSQIIDWWTQLEREYVMVTAFVHPENVECRAFCESAEFAITAETDSGYDVWSAEHYLIFNN